jgi:pathogenesis-related protein 1
MIIHMRASTLAKSRTIALTALLLAVMSLVHAICPANARAGGPPPDTAVVEKWIAAHNDVRARVSPAPAPPLGALVWSEEAAAVARAWAARCRFEHNAERGAFGENLFATSAKDPSALVEQAIASWTAEKKDFDVAANRCADGAVCGHYTQLVWRATRGVGCAVASCKTGSPIPKDVEWTLVVCNYAPPGNVTGEKPY